MTLGEATRKVLRKHVGDLKTGLLLEAVADACRRAANKLEGAAGNGKGSSPAANDLFFLAYELEELSRRTRV